ncbi:endolytic transglycosylase MltG [Chitinophaga pinensis]|uniref:Endolytic murein transglycosylase n=1 Tax=Chitinophaga pinensis (strain ATCC 43595 / DSM 2588 / LMG 13176 / NBRC 15968 / NCIMB 11800 / UQM 2034) TaxID=485918 RepID=A0A979G9C5_CHIPD|nr:endolytic transglycosylase MltG [Chitinophaga pinensis]ACU63339.1 aminodeoxychorismate lyase [Chitinophaga pinensis DSM 2588]
MAKKSKAKKSPAKNLWIKRLLVAAAAILAGLLVYVVYYVFGPNTKAFGDSKFFYIRTGSTYGTVLEGLEEQGIIRSKLSFEVVATQLGYRDRVKAGKYKISRGMSNFEIVKLLRSGHQTPVNLTITKLRTKQDLVRKICSNLEADSATFRALLSDQVYLRQFGLDTNTVMSAFLPNSYQFYWNTTAENAFKKIEKESDAFWNDTRKAAAQRLGLTPTQVVILASIVDEETNKNDEKPLISSVYLNRFRKGMRLQADPTVKFALQDFSIRRIREGHIAFESPYNTYQVTGLPPGPICTPSIKSIEAVLNTPETDYIYFCAKADFSGYHAFAASYAEHMKNAHAFHQALNARGI